jgi:hypothetical protein
MAAIRSRSVDSAAHRAAVRRSCQTIARCTGCPVRRSQTTTVSRWFVMPMASGTTPDRSIASRAASSVRVNNSVASCSTQPGSG